MRSPPVDVTFPYEPSAGAQTARHQEDNVLSHITEAATDPAAGVAPMTGAAEPLSSEDLLSQILTSLEEDKAEEVVSIDLRGKSEMADYMVVCSGRSTRQVAAISEKLVERLKSDHGRMSKVEGKEAGDWVLIDTGDIIVHVFRPEVREFYQLEKMWMTSATTARPPVQPG
ncbi:MAG: ribosome silencing factor [Celeribacter sp.]